VQSVRKKSRASDKRVLAATQLRFNNFANKREQVSQEMCLKPTPGGGFALPLRCIVSSRLIPQAYT